MISDTILHDRENDEETQQHLKDNGEKFSKQCVNVLRILYRGGRYTGKQINEMLNIACGDRRLRDLFAARSDVKREWVKSEDGKTTKWKEYWLDIPSLPTKQKLHSASQAMLNLKNAEEAVVDAFTPLSNQ